MRAHAGTHALFCVRGQEGVSICKYDPLATVVGSAFRAAVVERYGACCDSLQGFIRSIAGPVDRDPLTDADYTFSAPSRVASLSPPHACARVR